MNLYDKTERVKLLYQNGHDTLYIQKHLGMSFKGVMDIIYPKKIKNND